MGFGCAMGLNHWFYAPTPRQSTKNPKKAPMHMASGLPLIILPLI